MEDRLLFDAETLKNVTVADCEEMYYRKGYCAICDDGQLWGFVKEQKEQPEDHLKLIWLNAAI